jgi:hypothetical protein
MMKSCHSEHERISDMLTLVTTLALLLPPLLAGFIGWLGARPKGHR